MPTCHTCGGEIEFRRMGGRPTPIHVDGRWCSGYSSGPGTAAVRPFATVVSYVNPNARCPVCGKQVFYYQSPHGGRVFFDNLGWPWPKHGCTDNPRSQRGAVETVAQNVHTAFKNAQGEQLDLYELLSLAEKRNIVQMRFGRMNENRSFSVSLPLGQLREHDITTDDLKNAPSFVVRTYETHRIVEFISGRKKRIDTLKLARSSKASA
ncbi:hypothetical protein [Mesorhizobium sp. M1322]|uniref:hypothetical protein n=1 Tax=Mesorhizobium sp. M1322 TaxID=2957081 RepID=UPI0033395031